MDRHEGRPEMPVTPRLVLGLAVMLAGLVLALDSLGLLDAGFVFRFWPLILVAVGVVKWKTPYQSSSAFVWIVAGIALLFMTVGRMPASRLWAAALFFIGANIAWRALRPAVPRGDGDPASHVNMTAVLGGAKAVSHATDFRGGQAMATLGGCEIDLRHASIARGGRGDHRHLRLLGRDRDQGAGGLAGREPRQRLPGRDRGQDAARARRDEAAHRDGHRDHGRRRGQELVLPGDPVPAPAEAR